ncbi:MAG: HypC/HybG/HupF family hydrogenase formation chaperone [Candidatus Nealsonbacteria bacterium]|nr:HypC/HybG/HupF family hydrogenase formation chaperone [Candidatus Nealsonbacteria bacterium]
MCLAIPQEIVKIKGKTAWTKAENHRHQVDLSLLKNVKVGDFIIAAQELAINKISKSSAKKILKMISELRK